MIPARSHSLIKRFVTAFFAVTLVIATAPAASGQATTQELFSSVETLTLSDSVSSAPVSLSGDTAVVGGNGVAQVFERERGGNQWLWTATLSPSDLTSGFGRSVAADGRTIVVGADGAAYVFRRTPEQAWQEVAKLTSDTDDLSFGESVALSRTTIVVGAPSPPFSLERGRPGVALLFERDEGGKNAWGEVARLTGEPLSSAGQVDLFGLSVSIDTDTLVVGAVRPAIPQSPFTSLLGYVFSRNDSAQNAWSLEATIPLGSPLSSFDALAPLVSISGETLATSELGPLGTLVQIFQRERGQPNTWVEIDAKALAGAALDIDEDFLVVVAQRTRINVVFAPNQGGKNAWGEVWRVPLRPGATRAAISGDTVFLATTSGSVGQWTTTIEVYVADTDRDGLRDGLDSCPRDPLNNVTGRCQRASAVHPVLDELITQGEVTSETHGRRQIITATFTNTSDTAVQNPFFEVTELTGHNVLLNGDAGRGRVGATVSLNVGDGVLSPGESMTVTFRIRLRTSNPFQFFVTIHGDPVP